ncbi:MAG: hypothetical protein R3E77_02195 [Steroidobacteraceae bacterium]
MPALTSASAPLSALAASDPVMAQLIDAVGPWELRADRSRGLFGYLVHAIAHQQLTGLVAKRILERLDERCDAQATPERILALRDGELRKVGFSRAKTLALKDLAAHSLAGTLPDDDAIDDESDDGIIVSLSRVRGIGPWTAQMLLIFHLGRPDVLPVLDYGVCAGFRLAYGLRRLPRPKALAQYGRRWQPYRSYAAWYLWRAVELARENRLPAPALRVRVQQQPAKRPRKVPGRKSSVSARRAARARK